MAKDKDKENKKVPLTKQNFGYQKGELPEKIWTYLIFLVVAIIIYWILGIIGLLIDIVIFVFMERYLDKKYKAKLQPKAKK